MPENTVVLWEWALLLSAGLGSLFMFLAAWGNLRVPNVLARMHSAGMGSTLGIFLLCSLPERTFLSWIQNRIH